MTVSRCVRIDIGYDGREFFGSQRQRGVRTVQSELEAAVNQVTSTEVRLAFAGRTDRGVHAVGQVASGRLTWEKDLERLRYALDSLTGDDLVVYRVAEVDDRFHARFSAVRREYRYRIFVSSRAPVLLRGFVWWIRTPIDIERVRTASRSLTGSRDFRSFAGAGFGTGDSADSAIETYRYLDLAEWRLIDNQLEPHGELLEFRVRANAFLPHMVRNLVGALVEVGAGTREPRWIETLLELRDRKKSPPPAPPDGLTLWSVDYGSTDS